MYVCEDIGMYVCICVVSMYVWVYAYMGHSIYLLGEL